MFIKGLYSFISFHAYLLFLSDSICIFTFYLFLTLPKINEETEEIDCFIGFVDNCRLSERVKHSYNLCVSECAYSCLGWSGEFLPEFLLWKSNFLNFSQNMEHIWVISNEVDETRAYYTDWNKLEREKQIY